MLFVEAPRRKANMGKPRVEVGVAERAFPSQSAPFSYASQAVSVFTVAENCRASQVEEKEKMADIIVPIVLKNLIKVVKYEANLLSGVEGQVSLLERDLQFMNAFLETSAGKRDEHHLVQELVDQIRDVALKSEDVIDTYMARIIKQRRTNLMLKLFHCIGHSSGLHHVADEISRIDDEIKKIYENKSTFGIDGSCSNVDEMAEQELHRRRRNVEEDDVVGFANDTTTLVKLLTDQGNMDLEVVSIIGMGGLGKTTLARKIYNNTLVKDRFKDCCAWVDVSQGSQTKSVLLDILNCFMTVSDETSQKPVEELKDELGKCLKEKSRENGVAPYDSPTIPYLLQFLDLDSSWELLSKKAFRGQECPSNLVTVGKELAESCKGLPLSIVLLGEDYEISVKQVTELWIAEGFVQPTGNRTVYDIAEEYLEQLIDRSLVQVASRRYDGGVKTCCIHDILRDLCIRESSQAKFLGIYSNDNISSVSKFRQLSFQGKFEKLPSSIFKLGHLETIHLDSKVYNQLPKGIWMMKRLRHLHVSKFTKLPDLPSSMGSPFSNLQVLSGLLVQRNTALVIAKCPNIRKLRLMLVYNNNEEPRLRETEMENAMKNIGKLEYLESFKFESVYKGSHEKIRISLGLEPLLPSKLLTKISLTYPSFGLDHFKVLAKHPSICVLKITSWDDYEQDVAAYDINVVRGEFPQLQVLEMRKLKIRTWTMEMGAMPSLQCLVIDSCHCLKYLPEEIWCITTLQLVEVSNISYDLKNMLEQLQENSRCKISVKW
nr:putative disease resistance RPP13-like protein 3 [Ziziphus jujuba var. spinosa]